MKYKHIGALNMILLLFVFFQTALGETPDVRTYHLMGIPYAEANDQFSACAFTQKVVRWCRLLERMHYKYFVYANSNTSMRCRNVVQIYSHDERISFYGPDVNWQSGAAYFNQDPSVVGAIEWSNRVIREVNARKSPNDILLVSLGRMQQRIADETGVTAVEVGVGYVGSFCFFRIFESYNWLSSFYRAGETKAVSAYDAVIPMCYWNDEFQMPTSLMPDSLPYFAFVARVVFLKGVDIAVRTVCSIPSARLKIAGYGGGAYIAKIDPNCRAQIEYVGVLNARERNELIRNAQGLFSPTLYNEPFGSVVVESMFLGTPVITTDHGGMSETVWHGVTGFRCRTLRCFVAAAASVRSLDRSRIKRYAQQNYLCDVAADRYADYFQDVVNMQQPLGWLTLDSAPVPAQYRFYTTNESGVCFAA
jgi:glycosyltransferase involved in cell wall biosynthesis